MFIYVFIDLFIYMSMKLNIKKGEQIPTSAITLRSTKSFQIFCSEHRYDQKRAKREPKWSQKRAKREPKGKAERETQITELRTTEP